MTIAPRPRETVGHTWKAGLMTSWSISKSPADKPPDALDVHNNNQPKGGPTARVVQGKS